MGLLFSQGLLPSVVERDEEAFILSLRIVEVGSYMWGHF